METISDWQGRPIEVAESVSWPHVIALADPMANLIRGNVVPWPPPEIVQKLRRSKHLDAFAPPDQQALCRALGFYTDFQSLHSEDALVWSVFGLLAYADTATRRACAEELLQLIEVAIEDARDARFWLWRRVPHPEKPSSDGPEIDFGLATASLVLLAETKWVSGISHSQGVAGDQDQLTLRSLFLREHGFRIYPSATRTVLLTVSRSGGLQQNQDLPLGDKTLYLRDITWDRICRLSSHPVRSELTSYVRWKHENIRLS